MYYALLALFVISRLFFINTQGVFFDSGENISLFAYPDYFQAITSGHFPPHEGYIMIFWPIFQLTNFLSLNPVFSVIIGQIIFATVTIICFYKVVTFIAGKRTGLIASIIVSLTPLFWITNVTIMMEIGYIGFFFFSFYFLLSYLSNTKKSIYLHISAICLTLSFLTHMLIVLWLPLLLSIVVYKRKGTLLKISLILLVYLFFASILNVIFISIISKETIPAVFHHLYFTKRNEFANLSFDIKSILIALRNFSIPLIRNNTSLIFILGFLSLFISFKKNKKIFVFGLLWILPALYTNQWWDSLLNGRHALIANFGIAFMAAYLIRKKILLVLIVIIYLLFVSLPTLNLLRQPIPYLKEAEFVKSLPKNSLLIESHFARPQVQEVSDLKFFFVNEPGFDKNNLVGEINKSLKTNIEIFISSAALSEPYGLYSGPYLHNITLSYAKPFEMEPVIKQYTLIKYKEINAEDNLIIYKIKSTEPSAYPEVKEMKDSYRRIDYNDPLWRLVSSFLP
jgi:hypothetical protein